MNVGQTRSEQEDDEPYQAEPDDEGYCGPGEEKRWR
jgi:hypothetical protein